MKSIASVMSIIALGFGLVGCPSSGGGGGGDSTPAFAVATTAADSGVVGNAFTSTLAATGGTAPFTWTVFGGVLPTGLSLNGATGVVSGTPTTAGNSTVTFTLTDSAGRTATGSVLFAVHPRTDRVSVDSNGTAGNGASTSPSMSNEGALVAFVSAATNLVTGVSGQQVYMHDWQTNQTSLVSRDSNATVTNAGNGVSSAPSISGDGRLVAFVSLATNLVTGVNGQQIYVHDRQTGQTTLVSKSSTGLVGDGSSSAPAISADGRFVAFASLSTNLGASLNQQIYIHDRLATINGVTTLVSKDTATTTAGNGASSAPTISGDGRFVAFVSAATNIVAGFSGQQVYVHDRNTGVSGTNSLISRDNSGTPNAGNQNSSTPSISADGRFVAFTSLSTNLVTGVSGQQIYLHDRNGPTTSHVSKDNSAVPIPGNALSDTPSISGNGEFVAFFSQASNLLAGGVAPSDIYVRALP